MKLETSDSKKHRYLRLFACFLIFLGAILNEYSIRALFTEDGSIEHLSKLVIRAFDLFCIGFGFIVFISKNVRSQIINFHVFNELKNLLSHTVDFIITGFFILLLCAQFSYLVSAISQNQDNQGVIFATDGDASHIISVTKDANWFSHHKMSFYQSFYPRIAHTIERFAPNSVKTGKTEEELLEERAHFSLLLISLLSLYGISFLFAHLLIEETKFKILATLLITATFLNQSEWVEYVFRAHPDLLLCGLSVLFIYLLYKFKSTQRIKFFYLAAFIGGAALCTKSIFLIFLLATIFLEIPPFKMERILKVIRFYFLILISYSIIGFPVNYFYMINHIDHLLLTSSNTLPATWESFAGWWGVLFENSWQIFLMLGILSLIFSNINCSETKVKINKHLIPRLWLIGLLPFIFLLGKKVITVSTYWILPFAAVLLLVTAIWFSSINNLFISKLKHILRGRLTKYVLSLMLILLVEISFGIVPVKVESVLNKVMINRKEARTAYPIVNSYLKAGKKVFAGAYVPFNHEYENVLYPGLLNMNISSFKSYAPDVIVFNQWSISRAVFYNPEANNKWELKKRVPESSKFYRYFFNKHQTVIGPLGQEWIKTYKDEIGTEIWEKKVKKELPLQNGKEL